MPGSPSRVKGKPKRPTIPESQNSLIQTVESESDIIATISEEKTLASSTNRTLQPRMICAVQGSEVISSHVVINDTIYKVPTVLKALEISFKAHMVLNAAYSPETHNFYTFIQKHIFEISTKFDKVNSCVASLQETLLKH